MTSEAKIQANRDNAQKSTGPKSENGKERSSANAVKTGLHARKHFLRPENAADYETLKNDLYENWKPVGAMEERMVEQIVHHFLRLDLIDRAEGALLSDLTSRAAGERTCGVPQPSVFLINGRFQKLEEDQDQIRLDAGRDVEHTDEDFSNACKMAMSEPDPMKATALMDRQRHSAHRAIEHLEERLVLVQERRREREQKEEDERDFQASLRGSETDPRGFSRRKARRPVTASDGG